jgi:lysyl-tRNA synthetase class 1
VQQFANQLIKKQNEIIKALLDDECFNVTIDEIERSVDFLQNLSENAQYFQQRIGGITAFLPANQPLYASVCFGLVLSYLASVVSIRPPQAMQQTFKKLDEILHFSSFFPNVQICYQSRNQFIKDKKSCTQVVIFTGKAENGMVIRTKFNSNKVLFILNGAGHNPVVISDEADIDLAVDSALKLCLHNQGQDCAAPNSILIKTCQ